MMPAFGTGVDPNKTKTIMKSKASTIGDAKLLA
jgi:hypothetical protein